ncbi:N-acetylmuramoyl-L-alanine amidase [Ruminococcus sp. Marseille-P6503]|uniref:N-acetylmuramoyl-L-alanine amidase n=1 Tax=Ruminococcus sp. Marseille-P6503 TaxID=2364796 RepID=UPI000F540FD3|nr:N-acetylmuramoyl-L-alanine amidase [Ruminococcus sp. Marseille-P6503]
MKRKQLWTIVTFILILGISIAGSNLTEKRIAVETAAEKIGTALDRPVVVIDAGHGGMDGGCVSIDGVSEKGINLNIAMSLKDMLTVMGYQPVCTRESDISIHDEGIEGLSKQKKSDMQNRLELFNKYDGAVAVSIHQNQFTDSKYSGAQMFYSEKSSDSERLAGIMKEQFVSFLQPENKRETKPVGDELYLLNNSSNPAVMIECGFLSNQDESLRLQDENYQKQIAFTIFTGLCRYRSEA